MKIKTEHSEGDSKGRFVVYDEKKVVGELVFTLDGKQRMSLEHTEVKKEYGGQGLGHQLVMESVKYARAHDLKVIPRCDYAERVFAKDQEIQDVLN